MSLKKETELRLYILLEATVKGQLENHAIGKFTQLLLIAGNAIATNGSKKLKEGVAETFQSWLNAADKADELGMNRIVLNSKQIADTRRLIRSFSKACEWLTEKQLADSAHYIDQTVYS